MLRYSEYYQQCVNNYIFFDLLYNFKFETYSPEKPVKNGLIEFNNLDKYNSIIEDMSSYVDKCFENENEIYFPDDIKKDEPVVRLKEPWDIPRINELADYILPQLELRLFRTNVLVHGIYCYRTKVGDYKRENSWLWHYDNHPEEVIKVMIYLTDVDEKSGPFEILHRDGYKDRPSTRIDYEKWSKHHSRLKDQQVQALIDKGYITEKIIGKKGTITVFDNNNFHRANLCKEKHRDVLVLMMKPHHEKVTPFIDRGYTGTNYHKDVFVDPSFKGSKKK